MATATLPEAPVLTMAEIERLCDGEWVLIIEPSIDDSGAVTGGRVIAHDATGDDVFTSRLPEDVHDAAVLFIGEPPITGSIDMTVFAAPPA